MATDAPANEAPKAPKAPKAPALKAKEIAFNNKKKVKMTLVDQLKKGVILEAFHTQLAVCAQQAGAPAVMAITMRPEELKEIYGVARMAATTNLLPFIDAVALPVGARVRKGNSTEAAVLEDEGFDFIEESLSMGSVDEENVIDKRKFTTPFMCQVEEITLALKHIHFGASIVCVGGTPEVSEIESVAKAVYGIRKDIRRLKKMSEDELGEFADNCGVPIDLVIKVRDDGKLPALLYAAGQIVNPADAALLINLGCDGICIGQQIIFSDIPTKRIKAMVQAVKNHTNDELIADLMYDFENIGS